MAYRKRTLSKAHQLLVEMKYSRSILLLKLSLKIEPNFPSRGREHDARHNLFGDRVVDPGDDQVVTASPSSKDPRIGIIIRARKRTIHEP